MVETNDSKHPALVMELMQGGSLHDFLHCRTDLSPPLTPQAQHRIALDVALGLQYLHSLGWMHRDVRQPGSELGTFPFLDLLLTS